MNAYWRNREEQNQREYLLEEDEYVDRLQDILDYTLDQITKEINGFYTRYATKEGITYAEATQRVSQLDIEEYERKAKKYVEERDFSEQANKEMRLYNLTMRVNRLELLKSEIGLELVDNFMVIDDEMKGYLTERAMTEYTRQAGILGITVKDAAGKAEALVNASFRHATFSDRIWMYQAQLKSELDVLLREGLIRGQGPLELARHINKLFDTGKYNCERLMRTELARVQSAAQLDSFIANGFDEYQFNALGDACPDCAALDERHFKITDAEVGVNLPPIHPNCRCAVSAYMDDTLYNQWLDSYQSHGMSYEDWLARGQAADGVNHSTLDRQLDWVGEAGFGGEDEARAASIQELTGFSQEKAAEVVQAFIGDGDGTGWFGNDFQRIARHDGEKYSEWANALNDYVSAAPKYAGEIYRGLGMAESEVEAMLASGIFKEKAALSSWTSEKGIAQDYATGVGTGGMVHVILTTTSPGMGTPVSHLSRFDFEQEVLVSNTGRDSYKILESYYSDEWNGRILTVVLDM